jgi:hypothetical protein
LGVVYSERNQNDHSVMGFEEIMESNTGGE